MFISVDQLHLPRDREAAEGNRVNVAVVQLTYDIGFIENGPIVEGAIWPLSSDDEEAFFPFCGCVEGYEAFLDGNPIRLLWCSMLRRMVSSAMMWVYLGSTKRI